MTINFKLTVWKQMIYYILLTLVAVGFMFMPDAFKGWYIVFCITIANLAIAFFLDILLSAI